MPQNLSLESISPAMPDIPPDFVAPLMHSSEELTQLLTAHPELPPLLAAMEQAAQQTTSSARQELANQLLSFIRANTWAESKAYLEAHPERVQTDEAFEVLELLIEQAKQQDDEDALRTFTQHRDLLQRGRPEGIEAVFADLMTATTPSEGTNARRSLLNALIECDSLRAALELVSEHPELLSDEVDVLLEQSYAAQAQGTPEGEAYAQQVAARLNTRRQLRQMMDEAEVSAEEEAQTVQSEQQSAYEQVLEAVRAFGSATSEAERKRIVQQERELLLTDAALQVLADLLEQYKEDPNATRLLTQHRDLLQRCRAEGIDAAFAPFISPPSEDGARVDEGMPQAQALLQEIIQSDNPATFVEQNLARFTEQVQAAFAQRLTQAEGQMAQACYSLLEVIDGALRQQERARLTPKQQAMLDEIIALSGQEEPATMQRRRLLCEHVLTAPAPQQ